MSGALSGAVQRAPGGRAGNLRLMLLVLEGYAYLIATFLIFVGFLVLLTWGVLARQPFIALPALLIGLPAVALTGAAIRALLFRRPQPHGVRIPAREAPALHGIVEEVRSALGAPRVHSIVIAGNCNASAVQVPRLAIFWPRNTLVLGYPLLLVLSAEQLKAVIAHELGHLFHAHSRVAGWVFRTRLSWLRLAAALDERGAVPVFVTLVLTHYVPRLEARSAALGREQEVAADRCAAAVTETAVAADALLLTEFGARVLDTVFWPNVFAAIDTEPAPPRPFAAMRRKLARLLREHIDRTRLETLLQDATRPDDTHPSVADRLRSLGAGARLPRQLSPCAGDALLGSQQVDAIAEQLDSPWQEAERESWCMHHAERRALRLRLASLEAQAQPSADALLDRASVLERLGCTDEALCAYQAALEADNPPAGAALGAGRLLLARNNEDGVELIERAIKADEELVAAGCALLVHHHECSGRPAAAQHYRALARRHETRAELARAERATVSALDQFAPHGLQTRDLALLVKNLAAEPHVRAAFLARKQLRHSSGTILVLGLIADEREAKQVAQRLKPSGILPSPAQVVVLDRHSRALQQTLAAVDGAHIYAR